MKRIEVSTTKDDNGVTTAVLDCPALRGKKPSEMAEMVSIEIEYRIKALPIPESYKEELRVLIGAYGVLKSVGE
jgi:hypothetical protein